MKDQDYLIFDQYLIGELSAEKQATFEEKLKTDAKLASAFNLYKDVHSHLKSTIENEADNNAFNENLNNISENYFNQSQDKTEVKSVTEIQKKTKTVTLIKYAMAACVALLIGVTVFNKFNIPSYQDYNNHEPMTEVRGEVEGLAEATKVFNNKEYGLANKLLKKILDADPANSELKLYYAITNLELDNFDVADENLAVLVHGNSAYKNRAIWYSALSKLKQKDNKASIDFLQQIPEDADDYKKAQKLLNKLE